MRSKSVHPGAMTASAREKPGEVSMYAHPPHEAVDADVYQNEAFLVARSIRSTWPPCDGLEAPSELSHWMCRSTTLNGAASVRPKRCYRRHVQDWRRHPGRGRYAHPERERR